MFCNVVPPISQCACVHVQTAISANETWFSAMIEHVECELLDGTWNVLGWYKASTTKNNGIIHPRLHIVRLRKNGPIRKFVVPRNSEGIEEREGVDLDSSNL